MDKRLMDISTVVILWIDNTTEPVLFLNSSAPVTTYIPMISTPPGNILFT